MRQPLEEGYMANTGVIKAELSIKDFGRVYTAKINFSALHYGISLQITHESALDPYFIFEFLTGCVKKGIEGILTQELQMDLHWDEMQEEILECISSLKDQYITHHSSLIILKHD